MTIELTLVPKNMIVITTENVQIRSSCKMRSNKPGNYHHKPGNEDP